MQHSLLDIRIATVADTDELIALACETFKTTYYETQVSADLDLYLKQTFNKEKVLTELQGKGEFRVVFVVAFWHGKMVGYVKVVQGQKPVQSLTDRQYAHIEKFYLQKNVQNQGIGGKLMQQVLDINQAAGYHTLWLLVWDENPAAMAFYKKWNFEEVGKQAFILGNTSYTDTVLQKIVNE